MTPIFLTWKTFKEIKKKPWISSNQIIYYEEELEEYKIVPNLSLSSSLGPLAYNIQVSAPIILL